MILKNWITLLPSLLTMATFRPVTKVRIVDRIILHFRFLHLALLVLLTLESILFFAIISARMQVSAIGMRGNGGVRMSGAGLILRGCDGHERSLLLQQ